MSLKALIRAGFLMMAMLLSGGALRASEGGDGHGDEEKFNAGKLILDHIGDEHGWHLWGHTTLPLPIIVYNTERGVSVFSSSHFDHGHKTYRGYMLHEGSIGGEHGRFATKPLMQHEPVIVPH